VGLGPICFSKVAGHVRLIFNVRRNHMLLESHIHQKLGGSLSASDAQQFSLLLFSILDCIPQNLRSHKWDRALIAYEFSSLARAGIIISSSPSMREPKFWDDLITNFLMKRIEIDAKLQDRLIEQAR